MHRAVKCRTDCKNATMDLEDELYSNYNENDLSDGDDDDDEY